MLKRKRENDKDVAFFLNIPWDEEEDIKDNMTLPDIDGLSSDQINALHKVASGKRIFITGSAGTGKSFLLDKIKEMLENNGKTYVVTALTGVAASEIMGMTLHSASRVGENTKVDKQIRWLRKNKEVIQRYMADVWIIDEISMVNIVVLNKIHQVAKAIRGNDMPFGGIQVVVAGDFLQLPPITQDKSKPLFAFEYPEWAYLISEVVLLEEGYRQKDPAFLAILHEMRLGRLGEYHANSLQEKYKDTVRRSMYNANSKPITQLFSTNKDVNKENRKHYKQLTSSKHTFLSSCHLECYDARRNRRERVPVDSSEYIRRLRQGSKRIKVLSKAQKEEIKAIDISGASGVTWNIDRRDYDAITSLSTFIFNLGLPTIHKLKVGLQVMLRCNLSTEYNLVNGSRGTVVGFTQHASTSAFQDVRKHCETLDGFMRDLTRAIPVDKGGQGYPVVQFPHTRIVVMPNRWCIPLAENQEDKDELRWYACYESIPLSIAAAITIHKSQGLSLNAAAVSMDDIFAEGQCYVAFSRIRSLAGLSLLSFNPSAVKAHPSAVQYYNVIAQMKRDKIPLTSHQIQERFLRASPFVYNT